jgi:hypothetical protein
LRSAVWRLLRQTFEEPDGKEIRQDGSESSSNE